MLCSVCKHENDAEDRYCAECGSPLTAKCGSCGADLKPDAKFCTKCGTTASPVEETGSKEPGAARVVADYTPKHLADKILQSRSALEGERKQVTVLFADVKGSMDLAGRLDPERWHDVLDGFFGILSHGVHRLEGTVNQYTGDGIMALFGAPIAHEDHARRACYAAIQMRDELKEYADKLRIELGIDFGVRIGINSGEVVVGKIGDDLRMDYTAQGHVVGLAQRIEQLAAPGRIYLSQHTAHLVEGFFRLNNLGTSSIAGASEPIAIHELEEASNLTTRLDVARARGLTRFVGRSNEMGTLQGALEHARQGHGQVVGVVGDPGVGKSRLCLEFTECCKREGLAVFTAHCPAHGKNIPFIPVLELFRDLFGVDASDEAVRARQKIAGALLLFDPKLHNILPVLFDFMGVHDPSRPAPPIEPDTRQKQLFALMRQVYRAQSEPGKPAVVLVDDLHWVDPGSDQFIAQLAEATEGSHSMLLLNFRPEYTAAWSQKSHYQQLPLVPLGASETRELVDSLLGTDASIAELASRIVSWTSGNPFFTEEVIQTLIELGHLQGLSGSYRLLTDVEQLEVPANVQALLEARVDRLPDEAKRLLQTAAVIGKNFAINVLQAISDLPETETMGCIDRLKDGDFLHQTSLYPIGEYAFKHPLTHEVAYHSQLLSRQKLMHAAVARALEAMEQGNLDEHAALIAHHWESAGEALDAARWHRRAAEWTGTTDAAGSSRHWDRVRTLIKTVPQSVEIERMGIEACRGLLNLGWRLGKSSEFDEIFDEGRKLAKRSGDRRSEAILHNLYGNVLGTGGDIKTYQEFATEASRIADDLGDLGARRGLDAELATVNWWAGDFAASLSLVSYWLDEETEPDAGDDLLGVSVQMQLHWVHSQISTEMGRFDEARQSIALSDAAGKAHGTPEMDCWSDVWRSPIEFRAGSKREALATALQAVEQATSIGTPLLVTWANIFAGMAHVAIGEWDKAVAFEQEALSVSENGRVAFGYAVWAHSWMAEALLGLGDIVGARQSVDQALSMARQSGSRLFLMDALLAYSRVRIREGAEDLEIDRVINEVSSLVDQSGGRCRVGIIAELRAELAKSRGDNSSSADHLHEAYRLHVEMGAEGHAARVAKILNLDPS
jgi:adenylate cyclase